jgi:hypothetical protein
MNKKLAIILTLLVASIALFFYGKHYLFQMDWAFISSATSPDGAFTIKHYQSRTEAGHAPYGDNLVIESWGSFPTPKKGETFFAGYCGKDFAFKWEGNEKIIIRCPNTTPQDSIRTQAIMIHGIKVGVDKNNDL